MTSQGQRRRSRLTARLTGEERGRSEEVQPRHGVLRCLTL